MSFLPSSLWPTLYRLSTSGNVLSPSSIQEGQHFIARAVKEGLLPLLFNEKELPVTVCRALDSFKALGSLNQRRIKILLCVLDQIAEILREEPVVLLKGSDYGRRLYRNPSLRPMSDIDLLVPRDRMEAVTARFFAAGLTRNFYAGIAARALSHHEWVFVCGNATVELHHAFVQLSRNRIDYAAVWQRRVPFMGNDCGVCRLDDVDAFVYHAVSLATDEFNVPLLRYIDLWLMQPTAGLLDAAENRAREWGVERALYGTLRQALRLFPEFEPLGFSLCAERLLTSRTRSFLDRRVLPEPWEHGNRPKLPRAVQLWRKFWLMDGFSYRVVFVVSHIGAFLTGLRILFLLKIQSFKKALN